MKHHSLADIEEYLLGLPEEERIAMATSMLPSSASFNSIKYYEAMAYGEVYSPSSSHRMLVYHRTGEKKMTVEIADRVIKATFSGILSVFDKLKMAKVAAPTVKTVTTKHMKNTYSEPDDTFYVGQELFSRVLSEIKDCKVVEVLDGRCKVSDGNVEAVYTIKEMKDKFDY